MPDRGLRSELLCRIGLHRWKMYGPWKQDGEQRAMWARCECGASRHLMPNEGKYPRLIFGRGVRG